MGRKPDTLILAYFNRGDKIPDQSNRYSFTCKSCGKHFPKGRANHLIEHLTGVSSRCPSITQEDLTNILAIQASRSADKARKEAQKAPTEEPLSPFEDGTQSNGLSPIEILGQRTLPLVQGKGLSGLEALAEASRQVERPSESHTENDQGHNGNILDVGDDPFIDPNLESSAPPNNSLTTSVPDLPSIAASASNLEASLLQWKKQFEAQPKSPTVHEDSELLHHASTWHVPIRPAPEHSPDLAKAATFPVLIAASPSTKLHGPEDADQPPSKVTKTRSKFSESRRQEVQGVRQKRACIRCRMLRKPCSEEDPCPRCAEIKNPRLWSNSCVRVRISEAFDLYSAGLYASPAKVAVDKLQTTYVFEDWGDAIVLQPLGAEEPSARLPALTARAKTGDIANSQYNETIVLPKPEDTLVEDHISRYLSHASTEYPREVSKTMAYCQKHWPDNPPILIQKATSLYKTTHLLTSHPPPFRTSRVSSGPFFNTTTQSPNASHDLTSRESNTSPTSIATLTLLAVIEKIAATQCRQLLNEMEKCLVSRLQGFELLISSFLFFACVENLEHVFCRHETQAGSEQWLLPSPPPVYARKAADFCSFLQGLLRSRHIVEPLHVDSVTNCLAPISNKDENVKAWFEEVGFGPDLPTRRTAPFDPADPESLRLKHCAQFLLLAQNRGMVGFEEG